jgi:hypothetical protein
VCLCNDNFAHLSKGWLAKIRIATSRLASLKMTRFCYRITAAGLIENDKKYKKAQKTEKPDLTLH